MKTARKSSAKTVGPSIITLRTAYIEYLLTNGRRPASVYKFCLDLGIPEESFYAYAGSFYAFTIWIGIGVLGIYEALKKYL